MFVVSISEIRRVQLAAIKRRYTLNEGFIIPLISFSSLLASSF